MVVMRQTELPDSINGSSCNMQLMHKAERIIIQTTERPESGHLEYKAPGKWVQARGEVKNYGSCHDYHYIYNCALHRV